MSCKAKAWSCCYDYVEDYLVYTTKKELRVKNRFIAVINLIGLISITTYVIGWTIIIDKGYQLVGLPQGYVSTKVKGVAFNTSEYHDEWSFFESVDLVQPAIEMDGMFITTALTQTWQARGVCEGEEECADDDDCTPDAHDIHGVNTGECLDGYCQQYRYCPPENDTMVLNKQLIGVENFSIFIKVAVEFQDFDVSLINTKDIAGTGALVEGYNLFTLSDILDECEINIDDILETGALISGKIYYDCNFDQNEHCSSYPKFTWKAESTNEDSVSTGFNFRKAYYSLNENKTTDRLLVKYHGIRIRFNVLGQGGKFDLLAFSTTLGSGIALTAISAFVTEFLLRHCIPERSFYTSKRLHVVTRKEEESWARASRGESIDNRDITPEDHHSMSYGPQHAQREPQELERLLYLENQNQKESGSRVRISKQYLYHQ